MNYRHFNSAVFAAVALALGIVLLLGSGCYKRVAEKAPLSANADLSDSDQVFIPVKSPDPEYKGGATAWLKFLNENCRYPQDAVDAEVSGTVVVQFVIRGDGSVKNVTALSGPDILKKEAMRVISLSSGSWTPLYKSGRAVSSYKKQPIVFRLEVQN